MDEIHHFASLDEITSAFLNALQAGALGIAQVPGAWVDGHRPAMFMAGDNTIVIAATPGLCLGGVVLPAKAQTTLTVGGTLTNPAWYYVYAYASGGVITYEASTTAPDSSFLYKSGDSTRRYVGPAHANSTSTFDAARMQRGEFAYLEPKGITPSPLTATSFTTMTAVVPGTARLARVEVLMQPTSGDPGGSGDIFVRYAGDGTGGRNVLHVLHAGDWIGAASFDIVLSGATFEAKGASGYSATLALVSFVED